LIISDASFKARYRRLSVYSNYDALRGESPVSSVPFLLPPTWRKTFSGFFSDVWDAAVRALKTATRIIIIGFKANRYRFGGNGSFDVSLA
jgi:hypothetical protein